MSRAKSKAPAQGSRFVRQQDFSDSQTLGSKTCQEERLLGSKTFQAAGLLASATFQAARLGRQKDFSGSKAFCAARLSGRAWQ